MSDYHNNMYDWSVNNMSLIPHERTHDDHTHDHNHVAHIPQQEEDTLNHLPPPKSYDYLLKFLLVGDSDVGKDEILNNMDDDVSDVEPSFCRSPGVAYKATNILLDGKRIRLQLWDTSGQGRFSTIIRSYSRGAQGILLVYDITNKWSFAGMDRWLKEVEEYAPGVPKILVGNRLHLAFRRQVTEQTAETYASKHNMAFFEVSPLCNYNIRESCVELSRMALQRNGMEKLWKNNTVLSLQELCCRAIVARISGYAIEQLPLPGSLKCCLKSYTSLSNYVGTLRALRQQFKSPKDKKSITNKAKAFFTSDKDSLSRTLPSSSSSHRHSSSSMSSALSCIRISQPRATNHHEPQQQQPTTSSTQSERQERRHNKNKSCSIC